MVAEIDADGNGEIDFDGVHAHMLARDVPCFLNRVACRAQTKSTATW